MIQQAEKPAVPRRPSQAWQAVSNQQQQLLPAPTTTAATPSVENRSSVKETQSPTSSSAVAVATVAVSSGSSSSGSSGSDADLGHLKLNRALSTLFAPTFHRLVFIAVFGVT